MLARARHPGVVALVRFDEHADRSRLVMACPTDRTLAATPPSRPEEALRVLAAVAATVADLHAIGLAHRRLQPDHVLLADDRPLLCGFADATGTAREEDRALDDAALGRLVDLLAAHAGASAGGRSRAGRTLRSLAASHADTPTAAELARRAGKAVGGRPLLERPRSAGRVRTTRRPIGAHRALRRGAPLLAVPAVVALVVGWPSRPADHLGSAALVASTTSAAELLPSGNDHGPTTAVDSTPNTTTEAPVRIDAGGATYEVGRHGDQVVVADWACTGAPTAVLLRPSTGEVFFFDALPDAGLAVTGRRVATVPAAHEVVTEQVGAACPPLAVRDTAGATHRIGAP